MFFLNFQTLQETQPLRDSKQPIIVDKRFENYFVTTKWLNRTFILKFTYHFCGTFSNVHLSKGANNNKMPGYRIPFQIQDLSSLYDCCHPVKRYLFQHATSMWLTQLGSFHGQIELVYGSIIWALRPLSAWFTILR